MRENTDFTGCVRMANDALLQLAQML